jgi:ATP-binding cassette, subfamily B, bacterial PglK
MFKKIFNIIKRIGYLPKAIMIFIVLLISAALDIIVISITAPIIFASLSNNPNDQLEIIETLNALVYFVPIEIFAVALLLIKIIYQIFAFKWIYKIAFDMYFDISEEILNGVFSDRKNNIKASKLSVSITSEIEEFVKTVLLPSFQMLSELTLITFVIIYLASVNLALTSFFIFFCIVMFSLYRISISKKLNDLGLITRSTRLLLIENSQYIAMHKKEIQSLGAVNFFFKQISNVILKFSQSSARYQFFLSLPRLVIELLGLLGLLVLGITAPIFEINGLTLVIFGIATLRMLPALQRIYVAFTQIKFGERTIHFITSINETLQDTSLEEIEETVIITSIIKIRKDLELKILKNNTPYKANFCNGINFVIGKSGSGKTTLMHKIFDYVAVSKDKIRCSMMQQSTTVFPGSVFDNIVLDREFCETRLTELLTIFFKSEKGRLSHNNILSIKLGDLGKGLSGGQIQRISLIRTFLLHQDIYLIDEGLASLNPKMRSEIIHDINLWLIKNNSLAIIVTHDMEGISQYPVMEIK